jgi:hypothetical protein
MKKMLIPAIAAFLCLQSFAQTSTQRIMIKGGNSAHENFMKEVFLLPRFEDAIVEYKNGQRFKSKMNYNRAIGSLQFIDEKGDTLALSNEESISNVIVGNMMFVFRPMCLLALSNETNVKLYKREVIRIADELKTGGYGIPNSTGTITSIERADNWLSYNKIDINESFLLSKVTAFFIENEKGELLPAAKKNILGMFPKKEGEIKAYLKEKSLDLNKEDDLMALVQFLANR